MFSFCFLLDLRSSFSPSSPLLSLCLSLVFSLFYLRAQFFLRLDKAQGGTGAFMPSSIASSSSNPSTSSLSSYSYSYSYYPSTPAATASSYQLSRPYCRSRCRTGKAIGRLEYVVDREAMEDVAISFCSFSSSSTPATTASSYQQLSRPYCRNRCRTGKTGQSEAK